MKCIYENFPDKYVLSVFFRISHSIVFAFNKADPLNRSRLYQWNTIYKVVFHSKEICIKGEKC